jgi:hypothetical protein
MSSLFPKYSRLWSSECFSGSISMGCRASAFQAVFSSGAGGKELEWLTWTLQTQVLWKQPEAWYHAANCLGHQTQLPPIQNKLTSSARNMVRTCMLLH